MSDCTHDCSSCGESCGERTAPQDFRAPANGLSHIGKVIAVVSGKGGVGKSLVTSSLAVAMRRMGKTRPGRRHHRPLHPHRLRRPHQGRGQRAGHLPGGDQNRH